jgi:hypothetical protein
MARSCTWRRRSARPASHGTQPTSAWSATPSPPAAQRTTVPCRAVPCRAVPWSLLCRGHYCAVGIPAVLVRALDRATTSARASVGHSLHSSLPRRSVASRTLVDYSATVHLCSVATASAGCCRTCARRSCSHRTRTPVRPIAHHDLSRSRKRAVLRARCCRVLNDGEGIPSMSTPHPVACYTATASCTALAALAIARAAARRCRWSCRATRIGSDSVLVSTHMRILRCSVRQVPDVPRLVDRLHVRKPQRKQTKRQNGSVA